VVRSHKWNAAPRARSATTAATGIAVGRAHWASATSAAGAPMWPGQGGDADDPPVAFMAASPATACVLYTGWPRAVPPPRTRDGYATVVPPPPSGGPGMHARPVPRVVFVGGAAGPVTALAASHALEEAVAWANAAGAAFVSRLERGVDIETVGIARACPRSLGAATVDVALPRPAALSGGAAAPWRVTRMAFCPSDPYLLALSYAAPPGPEGLAVYNVYGALTAPLADARAGGPGWGVREVPERAIAPGALARERAEPLAWEWLVPFAWQPGRVAETRILTTRRRALALVEQDAAGAMHALGSAPLYLEAPAGAPPEVAARSYVMHLAVQGADTASLVAATATGAGAVHAHALHAAQFARDTPRALALSDNDPALMPVSCLAVGPRAQGGRTVPVAAAYTSGAARVWYVELHREGAGMRVAAHIEIAPARALVDGLPPSLLRATRLEWIGYGALCVSSPGAVAIYDARARDDQRKDIDFGPFVAVLPLGDPTVSDRVIMARVPPHPLARLLYPRRWLLAHLADAAAAPYAHLEGAAAGALWLRALGGCTGVMRSVAAPEVPLWTLEIEATGLITRMLPPAAT